jgi:hypothetical protein
LNLESERKQAAWREEQRGEELLCADTSMVEGHTKEGLVASDGEILKTKGDSVKIQKDGILQLSEENSCKLLLLALLWKIWIPARKCQTANFRNASFTVKNS